jgi:putative membrane protein
MHAKQFSRKLFLYPAAALLATLTAMAQAPGGGGGAQPQQPSMPQQPGQTTSPGYPSNSTGMPTDPIAPTQGSYSDQAFVKSALENSAAEQQLGQLAQQKSPSEDVKKYAVEMVRIHTQLDEQIKPIAKHLGVSEPKGPSKKEKQEIAKLEAMSGPQFDEEYIRVMVKDHQQVVKDFKNQAEITQDPNVKQAAQSDATVFEQHLRVIEEIAQKHNVTVEDKK